MLKSEIGRSFAQRGNERGVRYLEEALDELPSETHPVEHGLALAALGRYYHYQARQQDAIRAFKEALKLVRPSNDPFALTMLYSFLSGAYQHTGEHGSSAAAAGKPSRQERTTGRSAGGPGAGRRHLQGMRRRTAVAPQRSVRSLSGGPATPLLVLSSLVAHGSQGRVPS